MVTGKKFKLGDYVKFKNWDKLIEEYGTISIEEAKELLKNSGEEIAPEVIESFAEDVANVPFGFTKNFLDKKCGTDVIYQVAGFEDVEEGNIGVLLKDENQCMRLEEHIIPEEVLRQVSGEELKEAFFWTEGRGEVFSLQSPTFETLVDESLLTSYEEKTIGEKDNLLKAMYLAGRISKLKDTDERINENPLLKRIKIDNSKDVEEILTNCHFTSLNLVFGEQQMLQEAENALELLDYCKGEVGYDDGHAFKVFNSPNLEEELIILIQEEEYKTKNFKLYLAILDAINERFNGVLSEIVKCVKETRSKVETFKLINEMINEKEGLAKSVLINKGISDVGVYLNVYTTEKLRIKVREAKDKTERLEDDYRNALLELKAREEKLFAHLYKKESGQENELREALTLMKDRFSSIDFHSKSLVMRIRQPLLYWDDSYCDYLGNLYEDAGIQEELQKVFDKIFVTKEYVLYFEQGVRIQFHNNVVHCEQLAPASSLSEYIPNPHLEQFNCWGEYKNPLSKALFEENYIEVLSLICSAIAGINLADEPVMKTLIIYAGNFADSKCLKIPGREEMISFNEAVEIEEGDGNEEN